MPYQTETQIQKQQVTAGQRHMTLIQELELGAGESVSLKTAWSTEFRPGKDT